MEGSLRVRVKPPRPACASLAGNRDWQEDDMRSELALFLCAMMAVVLAPVPSPGQQPPALSVKPVVEKKIKELPGGPLFWRVETMSTLAEAQAAAGPTALAAEISGKVWLFTLGGKGGVTAGAGKVAEIGPVPVVPAP